MKYILKPIIAGVVMGVVAVGVYKLSMLVCPSGFIGNLISTVIAIAIAAVVYFFYGVYAKKFFQKTKSNSFLWVQKFTMVLLN